jgi:hypothetical protein
LKLAAESWFSDGYADITAPDIRLENWESPDEPQLLSEYALLMDGSYMQASYIWRVSCL